jgi:hypothetical protein
VEGIIETFKRGFLDRPRKLTMTPAYLEFEDKDFIEDLFTRFDKCTIKDYRYGVRWIRGFEFIVGREYLIYIRSETNEIIKLSFKSFYGIKKELFNNLYDNILKHLWELYFGEIAQSLINRFCNGEEIEVCNVKMSQLNVEIKVYGLLKEQSASIPWEKVATKEYYTSLVIFSLEDPKINRGYKYLDDWNTGLLYCVIKTLLNK